MSRGKLFLALPSQPLRVPSLLPGGTILPFSCASFQRSDSGNVSKCLPVGCASIPTFRSSSCLFKPLSVRTRWAVWSHVLNAGDNTSAKSFIWGRKGLRRNESVMVKCEALRQECGERAFINGVVFRVKFLKLQGWP